MRKGREHANVLASRMFAVLADMPLAKRPAWLVVQRWLMGTVLTGLAIRMTTEARR